MNIELLCAEMPPHVPIWWEGYVVGLSDAGYSDSRIIRMSGQRNFSISTFTVHRIIKENKTGQPPLTRKPKVRKQRPTPMRTKAIVEKVKKSVCCENPGTQRGIAHKVGVSQITVRRIISENLDLVKRHKAKVHSLLPRHIATRPNPPLPTWPVWLWKLEFVLSHTPTYPSNLPMPRPWISADSDS